MDSSISAAEAAAVLTRRFRGITSRHIGAVRFDYLISIRLSPTRGAFEFHEKTIVEPLRENSRCNKDSERIRTTWKVPLSGARKLTPVLSCCYIAYILLEAFRLGKAHRLLEHLGTPMNQAEMIAIWGEHIGYEFSTRDVSSTIATMVEDA